MDVKELRTALARIESLFAAAGCAGAAKDLRSVARLLDGHDGKSVEAFISETKEQLDRPTRTGTVTVDLERVALHADQLLLAGLSQVAFDKALSSLDSDDMVSKAEWAAIANKYRNAPTNGTHVYKFKSSKEARAAIRDAFIERHEANSKRGIIDRITKWAS